MTAGWGGVAKKRGSRPKIGTRTDRGVRSGFAGCLPPAARLVPMTVATILILWCTGSILMAPLVGRAIRRSADGAGEIAS